MPGAVRVEDGPELSGACIGVLGPVSLGTSTADTLGRVTWILAVPPALSGRTVWLQAWVRAPGAARSTYVERVDLP